jgi:SnoaL-like domain
LWRSIEARDWAAAGRLLAVDAEIYWPHSGEIIRGRDNYIGLNREYPEGWGIVVLSVLSVGDRAVVEARVPHKTLGVSYVAAFYQIKDGVISRGTEYWVDEASQSPPDWRRRYTQRHPTA